MLRGAFAGRLPSRYVFNPFIKSFILSEVFLWSAWNFIIPIFSVYVATQLTGGNIQTASFAFSFYLIARVIVELISSFFLEKTKDKQKLMVVIAGNCLLSVAYLGFAFFMNIQLFYFFFIVAGIGLGIGTPAKNCLFSAHLDKNRETTEWGMYDAIVFIGMALAASLGGLIANQYGFSTLYILASIINIIGIVPYLLYIR